VDFRKRVLLPFFAYHLKGEPAPELAEAMVFETGANRWRYFDGWAPGDVEENLLYLDDDGSLGWQSPTASGDDFDAFVSDPENPVPYTATITTGWHAEYMVEDQRFVSRRPDVLVYRSEVLEEDVTLAGELQAQLWVATTGSDADWMVKLVDEYPGRLPGFDKESEATDFGHTERLVRSEMFRGRFREGYDHSVPFEPGKITPVEFPLQGVFHTFKKGHRIVIQIQSSMFPFFDRNPQTFVPNIFEAEEADFVAATHRVYHSAKYPSAIRVGVVPTLVEEEDVEE
jgi:putative CocE/NonD family hydrolase